MPNFRMKRKWLGTEETPYECKYCDNCGAINWYAGQNPSPGVQFDTEAIQCWKCGDVFWVDESYAASYLGNFVNASICHGQVDPSIPNEVLETVLDAAEEQFEAIKGRIRTKEDDPALVEMVTEIRLSINYIKTLLNEGEIPEYNPPKREPPPYL